MNATRAGLSRRERKHNLERFPISGFTYQRVFRAERPKQARSQSTNTHSRNTQDNCKYYQEHTWQSANNCKYHTRYSKCQRCLNARYLGLVLFILGSWLAIVVDVFIILDSHFSINLMAVGGEVAGLSSR
jgi:hypothetical protein